MSASAHHLPFAAACPICGASAPPPEFTMRDVPVFCNVLHDSSQSAADAPCGDIELSGCPDCGLIYNRCFDTRKVNYSPSYENALHFSGRFREFAEHVADDLVERLNLRNKAAAEIGCGDAYFLRLLTDRGVARGVGYDPSMRSRTASCAEGAPIEVRPEPFNSRTLPKDVDVLICRHVLEHIDDPVAFLRDLRNSLGKRDTMLYFEVPNAQWMLNALSLWDVIYEHCTYWTAPVLEATFRQCGFTPWRLYTGYGGQFLMIEARPDGSAPVECIRPGKAPETSLAQFGHLCTEKLNHWSQQLGTLDREGRQALAWGAGSKGVTFVNAVDGADRTIRAMVDVNPRKRGQFVGRRRIPVLGPQDLPKTDADVIYVMNPMYTEEIRMTLMDLGLTPEIVCV